MTEVLAFQQFCLLSFKKIHFILKYPTSIMNYCEKDNGATVAFYMPLLMCSTVKSWFAQTGSMPDWWWTSIQTLFHFKSGSFVFTSTQSIQTKSFSTILLFSLVLDKGKFTPPSWDLHSWYWDSILESSQHMLIGRTSTESFAKKNIWKKLLGINKG